MNKSIRTGFLVIIGFFLIVASYLYNKHYNPYPQFKYSKQFSNYTSGKVTRIIDSGTVEINSTNIMSLNGIDPPYSNELFYQKAIDFLNKTLINQKVDILISKTGWASKHHLIYIFLNGENINAAMVKKGIAAAFYPAYQPESDVFYKDMKDAQAICLKEQVNYCNLSKLSQCLIIDQLRIESQKEVFIRNQCKQEINLNGWEFKGNGRIQKDIRENMIMKPGETVRIDLKNYIFDTVNEQFKKQIVIRDQNKQLVFYHDFY